jgi:phage shock protein E
VSSKQQATAPAAQGTRSYRGRPVDHVIDVRSKVEYWLGHLDGATCIPLNDMVMRIAARTDVDPDSRIMVYCASGARSAAAATQLRAMGYRHVTDAGAMSDAFHEYKP